MFARSPAHLTEMKQARDDQVFCRRGRVDQGIASRWVMSHWRTWRYWWGDGSDGDGGGGGVMAVMEVEVLVG